MATSDAKLCTWSVRLRGGEPRSPPARLGDRPRCGKCKQALFTGEPVDAGRGELRASDHAQRHPGGGRLLGAVVRPVPDDGARLRGRPRPQLEPRVRLAKLNTEEAQSHRDAVQHPQHPDPGDLRSRPRGRPSGRGHAAVATGAVGESQLEIAAETRRNPKCAWTSSPPSFSWRCPTPRASPSAATSSTSSRCTS